jgi:hypothetical protein
MNFNASWHAEGLRWIGSLFNGVADYLDRSARPETAAPEQAPMRPAADHIDEVRSRMRTHMRGLL